MIHRTRRVALRPVRVDDYAQLVDIETDEEVLHTWRLRGWVPDTLQAYEQKLWEGVTDLRVIEATQDPGQPLGLAQLYNVDFRLRSGWFSIICAPSLRGTRWSAEAMGLMLHRSFVVWDLRRIYFHSLAENYASFSSLEHQPGYQLYGELEDRAFVRGEPMSVMVGGIDREPWMKHHGRLAERLMREPL